MGKREAASDQTSAAGCCGQSGLKPRVVITGQQPAGLPSRRQHHPLPYSSRFQRLVEAHKAELKRVEKRHEAELARRAAAALAAQEEALAAARSAAAADKAAALEAEKMAAHDAVKAAQGRCGGLRLGG